MSAGAGGDDDRPSKKPRIEQNNQKTVDELAWNVHIRYNGTSYTIEVRIGTTCGNVLDEFFERSGYDFGLLEPSNCKVGINGKVWDCDNEELRAALASEQGLVKHVQAQVIQKPSPQPIQYSDSDDGEDGEEEDGEEKDGEEHA